VPKPASVTDQPLWTSRISRAGHAAGKGNAQGAAAVAVPVLPQEIPQLAAVSAEGCFLLLLSETSSRVSFNPDHSFPPHAKEAFLHQLCSNGQAEITIYNQGKPCRGKMCWVRAHRGPCEWQGTGTRNVSGIPT